MQHLWPIMQSRINPDKRAALVTEEEKKALQDKVRPDWDEENLGEPLHHCFIANVKAGLMMDEHFDEENESKQGRPATIKVMH